MNLLVKKMGLVFLPALFFACEEPTELGANLNPNSGNLSTHYIELPITTAQVRSDSVVTALRSSSAPSGGALIYSNLSLGRLQSEDFGTIKTSLYANLAAPNDSTITLGTQATLDSAKIRVVWNKGSVYGKGITQTQRYAVHQLLSAIPATRSQVVEGITGLSYQYNGTNKQEIAPEPLGELTLDLANVSKNLDTTLLNDVSKRTLSLKLPTGEEDFARRVFRDFRNDPQSLRTQAAFEQYFKGIAIVPAEENTYLLSLDLANAVSGVTFYYTQGTQQYQLYLPFVPAQRNKIRYLGTYPAYYSLEADRAGTGLANNMATGHLQEFQTEDGRLYFQALSGLLPKVEFNAFKEFLLSFEKDEQIVLNRALLEFDSLLAGVEAQPLPQAAELYFVDDANRSFAATSPILGGGAERAFNTRRGIYAVGETPVNYIQSDLANNLEQFMKTGEDRYLQAMLYPAEANFYSPNKFVIRSNQVKLKIWYTKLKGSSL